ncbi:hypothetical protein GCM10010195_72720 [Kitasatospora griseola]|nr:hypothetical protein GCM10010195_72720 [Kitasatospora griseola]
MVGVGDGGGQADDPYPGGVLAYAGEERFEDGSADGVAEQVDLVDDEAADVGKDRAQGGGAADRFELLGGGDPQVGAADQVDVDGGLAGEAGDAQSGPAPGGEVAVEFVGQGALRHQPGGFASALARGEAGDLSDRSLTRPSAGDDHHMVVAVGDGRDGGGLDRVERRVRQQLLPCRGHQLGDGHER